MRLNRSANKYARGLKKREKELEKRFKKLKEGYILSQLSWHKRQSGNVLPPNCPHSSQNPDVNYYKELGLCNPNNLCLKGKNPTNYAIKNSIILKNKNKRKLYKQGRKTKSYGKNKDHNGKEYNSETIQGKSRKI